tara:strand:+ start:50 stop:487 length:438 start_codon:yes stop_codon:yes gene_type:complete
MCRVILLSFLLIIPNASIAQIQIGDIEVGSLKELFNKQNDTLWNEFGVFHKADSDIWINDMPSMLMSVGDEEAVILAIKKELNQDSVRIDLINQLNEQFGEFEEKEGPPMMDLSSIEWRKKEDGITYIFLLSKDKKVGSLNIFRR